MNLRFVLTDIEQLQARARADAAEHCAAGLVHPVGKTADGGARFVVRTLEPVPDDAYAARSSVQASLKPAFCTELANRAKREGAGVLLMHSHVGSTPLHQFSAADDDGEVDLARYFRARLPHATHFAALVTGRGVLARELGSGQLASVHLIGRQIDVGADTAVGEDRFHRQILAFGHEGQARLARMRVAIVGLGGTGSLVAQQLAHLGVGEFVLVDPDTIEASNLNRVVGARTADIGSSKVSVSARMIQQIRPGAGCCIHAVDIVDAGAARVLEDADFIFGCTDSMASRALLNVFAYQNLVPCIDMGVAIGTDGGRIKYIAGRTQMLSPGLACMVCTDKLDAEQIRRELMSPEQRAADPYIVGAAVAQPSVISLNSTVAAAAVTMFLAAATGVPSEARLLTYDGIRGVLRAATMEPARNCIVCSSDGALARGASWDLPERRSAP